MISALLYLKTSQASMLIEGDTPLIANLTCDRADVSGGG